MPTLSTPLTKQFGVLAPDSGLESLVGKFPLCTLQVNKHKQEGHKDPEEHRLGKVA